MGLSLDRISTSTLSTETHEKITTAANKYESDIKHCFFKSQYTFRAPSSSTNVGQMAEDEFMLDFAEFLEALMRLSTRIHLDTAKDVVTIEGKLKKLILSICNQYLRRYGGGVTA
jgi:hypothetical protein